VNANLIGTYTKLHGVIP